MPQLSWAFQLFSFVFHNRLSRTSWAAFSNLCKFTSSPFLFSFPFGHYARQLNDFFGFVYIFLAGKLHGEILGAWVWPENTVQLTQIRPETETVECGRRKDSWTRNTKYSSPAKWKMIFDWLAFDFVYLWVFVFFICHESWTLFGLVFTLVVIGQLTSNRYRDLCVITLRLCL